MKVPSKAALVDSSTQEASRRFWVKTGEWVGDDDDGEWECESGWVIVCVVLWRLLGDGGCCCWYCEMMG